MDVLQGEALLWTGHPSWRALLLFYVKWTIVSLIPAAIWVLLDARHERPAQLGDLLRR